MGVLEPNRNRELTIAIIGVLVLILVIMIISALKVRADSIALAKSAPAT